MTPTTSQLRATAQRTRGFTLIELLVAMMICAILASIAVPTYRAHVVRSYRTAAQAAMMDIAVREQQFMVANRAFVDRTGLAASGYALPTEVADYYTLAIDVPATTVPTFTITMTPTGGQAADGALTLDSSGVRSPADKWQR